MHQPVWDRLLILRRYSTDTHTLAISYNCFARLGVCSSFSLLWRPPFTDTMLREDRGHLIA